MYVLIADPDRTQKLKDAQSEAEKDIAALKKEKEEGITSFQKQFEGSQSQEQGVLDQDKKQKLAEIKEAFSSKNDELVQKLLDRVASVEPKPHRNLHKIEA